MNKYNHINSVKELDAELARKKLEKQLINQQLSTNVEIVKEAMKPSNLLLLLAQSLTSKKEESSLPNLLVRISSEILKSVQATKYGFKLLNKLF